MNKKKKLLILSLFLLQLSCSFYFLGKKETSIEQNSFYQYLKKGEVQKALKLFNKNPHLKFEGKIVYYESDRGYSSLSVSLSQIHKNFFKNAEFVKIYIKQYFSNPKRAKKLLKENIIRYASPFSFEVFYKENHANINPVDFFYLTVLYSNKELAQYLFEKYKIDIQAFSSYDVASSSRLDVKKASHFVNYLDFYKAFPQSKRELLTFILLSKESFYFLNYFQKKGLKIYALDNKALPVYYTLAFSAFHQSKSYKKTLQYLIKKYGAIQFDKEVLNTILIAALNLKNYTLISYLRKLYKLKLKASAVFKVAVICRDIKYVQALLNSDKGSKKFLNYILKDLLELDFRIKEKKEILTYKDKMYSLMCKLMRLKDVPLLKYLVKNFHLDVNQLSRRGDNILFTPPSLAFAKALIQAKIDLNQVTKNGHNLITYYFHYNFYKCKELVPLFINSGADIFRVNLEDKVKNPKQIKKILEWKFFENKITAKEYLSTSLLSKTKLVNFFKTADLKQIKRFLYYAQKDYIPFDSKDADFIIQRVLKNRPAEYKQLLLDYINKNS